MLYSYAMVVLLNYKKNNDLKNTLNRTQQIFKILNSLLNVQQHLCINNPF